MIHKFQSWIDKKQFCPTIEGIENEDLENLANKLKGDSEKETLTNILEWQDRNIQYWNERGILEIPLLLLTPIYFILCVVVATLLSIAIYLIILPFLGIACSINVGLLIFVIFLAWLILQGTITKLIFALLFFYPVYGIMRLFIVNLPSNSDIIDIGLIITSFNGVLFGASLFTLIYVTFSYLPLFRGDPIITKTLKLLDILNDTFKLSLSVDKILNYKLAICRDYAKFTASLLFRLYPNIAVYFITIPRHVAAAIKISDTCYVLDQHLPIMTLDRWLIKRNQEKAVIYKSKVLKDSKGEPISVDFNEHEKITRKLKPEHPEKFDEKLTKEIGDLLGIKQISHKNKPDFEIFIKDYAVYYEDNDIVKHSLSRAIKNKLENDFCGNVDKISKIEINQYENKKDLNLSVYFKNNIA
ncbi:MAG: transglutaminase-like domain-containing protein [Methanosarcinales archaeon]|nr:transglutaminase-like domain-containing protein [Methanosarcinales archaeon]